MSFVLKGQGQVTLNISIIYSVAHTWPLCSAQTLVDWGESTIKLLLKIHQHMNVSFVALRSSRVNLQNSSFILNKIVENFCDMPVKNTAKSSFHKKFVYITWPGPFKRENC